MLMYACMHACLFVRLHVCALWPWVGVPLYTHTHSLTHIHSHTLTLILIYIYTTPLLHVLVVFLHREPTMACANATGSKFTSHHRLPRRKINPRPRKASPCTTRSYRQASPTGPCPRPTNLPRRMAKPVCWMASQSCLSLRSSGMGQNTTLAGIGTQSVEPGGTFRCCPPVRNLNHGNGNSYVSLCCRSTC